MDVTFSTIVYTQKYHQSTKHIIITFSKDSLTPKYSLRTLLWFSIRHQVYGKYKSQLCLNEKQTHLRNNIKNIIPRNNHKQKNLSLSPHTTRSEADQPKTHQTRKKNVPKMWEKTHIEYVLVYSSHLYNKMTGIVTIPGFHEKLGTEYHEQRAIVT